jgi:hypothetical protein
MMNQCPCINCQERIIGCHSSCQKYKDWSAEERRLKEEYKKKNPPRRWIPKEQYYEAMRRFYKKGR